MKKYYIETMGCQLNENDSEKIAGITEKAGFEQTNNPADADLVIFNTCCVRENAEERLFGKLGELKKQREEKGTIIAIGGCMMQEPHILDKIKQSYNYTDIVFGTHNIHRLPQLLKEVVEKLHLEKAADSVKEKYSKLYCCLMIIDKILAPRLAEPKKGNEFFKAFIPSAEDFHFTIELNTKELKEILSDDELDRLKNTTSDCIALGNKIKVERVLPEMYLDIAYLDEKILQKYPKIRNVDEYYVCKD